MLKRKKGTVIAILRRRMQLYIYILLLFCFLPVHGSGPGGVGNTLGSQGQPRLVMWLDAQAIDPSQGPLLSLWLDRSGNGNHAQVPFLSQSPEFITSFLNNNAVVRFDSQHQQYFELDGSILTATDYYLTYVAARGSSGINFVLGGSLWGEENRNLHMGWSEHGFISSQYGNDINAASSGGSGSGVNEFGIFSTGLNADGPAPARRFFQNALQTGSINNRNHLLSYPGAALARNNNLFYDVDLAEVIFFSQPLNDAATIILNNYLSVKYLIPLDDEGILFSHPQYNHQLIGIGTTDGLQKHSATSGSGGGLYLREADASLDENNEFVFAAHSNLPHGITTSGIAPNDIASSRWNRDWYVKRLQAGLEGNGSTSVRIGFNFTEAQLPLTEGTLYTLLYRPGLSDDFYPVGSAISLAQGNTVWFTLPDELFLTGYYTIALANFSGLTWYTYKNGEWNDHTTWTTNPSGSVMEGPSGVIPGILDKAVILPSNTVIINQNNIQCQVVEIQQGALLDMGSTTGHHFYSMSGEGSLRLSSPHIPQGDLTAFTDANGGTVEFYGSSMMFQTQNVFNNLKINLELASSAWTLTQDLHINGNLMVQKGNFRINDEEKTRALRINVHGNLNVAPEGSISVGVGNTATGFSIPSGLPLAGDYHSIFHQITLYGNFTNQGQVRFTNQTAPDYGQFTYTGAVTMIFAGNHNALASLQGPTAFYNLVVHKGNNRNTILEINASNENHFAIYGPNNLGINTESPFSSIHPEVRKALWIRSGTLRLTGSITIPSLTEGCVLDGTGDYIIGSRSGLWIDAGNVNIHITIAESSQGPVNSSGFSTNAANSGLTLFGSLRISSGYFGTRHSAGICYWPQSFSEVLLEGGTLETSVFYTGQGGSGQTIFRQLAGTLLIRGDRSANGGLMPAGIPVLGIRNPYDVFQVYGGEIIIQHPNSEGLLIAADKENVKVLGGNITLNLYGVTSFLLKQHRSLVASAS
jgi:hypothetical protein